MDSKKSIIKLDETYLYGRNESAAQRQARFLKNQNRLSHPHPNRRINKSR